MAELQLTQADLAGIAGSGNAVESQSKIWKISSAPSQPRPPNRRAQFEPALQMRCDAVGHDRSPRGSLGQSRSRVKGRAGRDPKPGPALYVLRALALALKEQPNAAARLIAGAP
jgi:hypothetical protein